MEIKIASQTDNNLWDNLVNDSKSGTIFHTWDWLNIIKKHTKKTICGYNGSCDFIPLMVFDKEDLTGIMPIYCYKFPTFKVGLSPPLGVETMYLGPIMVMPTGIMDHSEQYKREQFIADLDNYLKKTMHFNSICINTIPKFYDPRPFLWEGYKASPKFTHLFDLTRNEEKIWGDFGGKLRQDIKKTYKKGINVYQGKKDDYNNILNIRNKRIKFSCGTQFFDEIYEKFYPNNLNIFCAEKDGSLLSGLIVLCFKQRMYAWIGVPKCVYEGTYPNELLYWEAIKWGIQNDYKELEIMGADGKALNPFKRKFNGSLAEYYCLDWQTRYMNLLETIFQPVYYLGKMRERILPI
ncbi:MAG: peptidoglycan bridge formation glycyltransferase FemA/FemB family protein [Candidatus Bathyarchaeota archaeon]|nr:peptidoglycan bridge formation glycyltransferase FemA/FemB family protein [Candidatus Bathyarchaeota archaeon]